jgi:hypothetical protein
MATSTAKDKDKPKTPEEVKAEAPGLESLGNPADVAHPTVVTAPGIAHQDGGSNQEQRTAADEAAKRGFIGDGAPEKYDYSQANPEVMNGGK